MTIKRCLAAASLLVFASSASAQGVDVSLSDETAHFVYLTDSGSLGYGGADVGFGLFFNEHDDYLGTANLLVTSHPSSGRNVQLGVGTKAYAGQINDIDETAAAVAIGGLVRYVVPSETPMGLALEGYVAPTVTSFSDTESVNELMARFEVEVMPSTRGYVGYRFLEAELEEYGEAELDDHLHVGIRISF